MKISKLNVYNLDRAIEASKYPMALSCNDVSSEPTETTCRLAIAPLGSGHDNFLSGILVTFNIRCSIKLWIQLERYHFLQIVSSQSIMHRALKMSLSNHFNKWVDEDIKNRCIELQTIAKTSKREEDYLNFVYSLPSGFELEAEISTNYLQLKTIYNQRKGHKLPEWKEVLDGIINQIPYPWLVTSSKLDTMRYFPRLLAERSGNCGKSTT